MLISDYSTKHALITNSIQCKNSCKGCYHSYRLPHVTNNKLVDDVISNFESLYFSINAADPVGNTESFNLIRKSNSMNKCIAASLPCNWEGTSRDVDALAMCDGINISMVETTLSVPVSELVLYSRVNVSLSVMSDDNSTAELNKIIEKCMIPTLKVLYRKPPMDGATSMPSFSSQEMDRWEKVGDKTGTMVIYDPCATYMKHKYYRKPICICAAVDISTNGDVRKCPYTSSVTRTVDHVDEILSMDVPDVPICMAGES